MTTRSAAPATSLLASEAGSASPVRPRLDSLDWLRGLVMILMVLDHTRDFFSSGNFNPRDPNSPVLFLTRWVTHFCAPTFVFLAGVGASLYGARGRTRAELSRFLATRGLWLIVMELTLVRFGWTFNFRYDISILQVIWVIGVGLLILSALIYLPRKVIAGIALTMVLGHNLLDGLKADQFGHARWLWMLIHEQGFLRPNDKFTIFVVYPLVPWIAVLALGYVFGPAMQESPEQRRRACLRLGLILLATFVLLRATNLYGDPRPWKTQPSVLGTVLSFVNCEKYPPSLLFLCMTLGGALLLLGAVGEPTSGLGRVVVTFGRVPFFFYISHIFLLHAMAVFWAQWHLGDSAWLFRGLPPGSSPPGFGVSLPVVYLLWLIAVAMLYPVCRWFATIKQTHKDWWLSYL
jgi:uncharacterized membrane protein